MTTPSAPIYKLGHSVSLIYGENQFFRFYTYVNAVGHWIKIEFPIDQYLIGKRGEAYAKWLQIAKNEVDYYFRDCPSEESLNFFYDLIESAINEYETNLEVIKSTFR